MGVTGWGEINNMENNVTCRLAESLSELIIGENPTRIEHHWQRLFRAHRKHPRRRIDGAYYLRNRHGIVGHRRQTLECSCLPLARWSMPATKYGSIQAPKPSKQGPGGSKPFAGTPTEIEGLVQKVRDAREQVGPDGAVMFDAHSCLTATPS